MTIRLKVRRQSKQRARLVSGLSAVALMPLCLALARAAEPDVAVLKEAPPVEQENPPAIQFWNETRGQPRPLAIHVLKVDLNNPRVQVAAAIGADPDGDGPAESQLVPPLQLAESNGLTAAVNANAFGGLPDADGKSRTDWYVGMPVDIVSWAATGGRTISQPKPHYAGVWIGLDGRAGVGYADTNATAREAAAGFDQILRSGAIVCSTNAPLHPRTSAGLDRLGRFLWLAVADGRQPGYSQGMTTHELAELMKSLGCWDAVNLDGGGSTVMLAPGEAGLRIVNRPSDRDKLGRLSLRPVPVLLGVRLRP